jgi:hypothetical protein
MAKCTFDDIITVEDADGGEHDIEVTIYYEACAPDPSVGYNGGMEDFGFKSSEHAEFNVKWLEEKLNSDLHFSDYIQGLIIADIEGREYDPGPEDDSRY